MSPRADRPSVRSRLTLAAGVAGLALVAVAARMPAAQQTPPAAPTPAVPTVQVDTQTITVDSVALPDTAAIMTMSMPTPAPAPATAAPTAWPVDPVTGQTLVNGVPVVGRVFIMGKTDGLVKIASVASALAKESLAPEAAIVAPNRAPLPGQATRRLRTAMAQATLWDMDHKRSAVRNRHFRETTSGASLGQR